MQVLSDGRRIEFDVVSECGALECIYCCLQLLPVWGVYESTDTGGEIGGGGSGGGGEVGGGGEGEGGGRGTGGG